GKRDDCDGIGWRVRAPRLQCAGPLNARLAAGNAQLEDPARGEERSGISGERQLAPLEARIRREHLALAIALGTRARTYAVRRLYGEQRLVAEDAVKRLQVAGEVLGELFSRNAHSTSTAAMPRPPERTVESPMDADGRQ